MSTWSNGRIEKYDCCCKTGKFQLDPMVGLRIMTVIVKLDSFAFYVKISIWLFFHCPNCITFININCPCSFENLWHPLNQGSVDWNGRKTIKSISRHARLRIQHKKRIQQASWTPLSRFKCVYLLNFETPNLNQFLVLHASLLVFKPP
jgi:hypothetical protein